MTSVRALAALAAAAVVALLGTAALGARERAAPAPAAAVPADPAPAGTSRPVAASTVAGRAVHPSVPAGILARAAGARALERAPACPPTAAGEPGCGGAERESVEIEWNVDRRP